MENVDNIFWDIIPNATKFINDVVKKLSIRESVILVSSDDIPWYSSFCSKVEGKISNYDKRMYDRGIYHEDELEHEHIFEDEEKLEDYILNNSNYFELKKQNEYRSSMKLPEFMAQNDEGILIHKKYIWIDLYSEKGFDNWVRFVSDYIESREKYLEEKYDKIIAGFIIAYHGDFHSTYKINSYSFKDYIDWYDCYVFFTILSSNFIDINEYLKLYLSELLINVIRKNITGKNIEFCVECLNDYNNFIKEPSKKIKNIFSDYKINDNIIKEIIYRSQIRIIYPMLNEFRLYYFIKKYESKLSYLLHNEYPWIKKIFDNKHNKETPPKKIEDFQFGLLEQCKQKIVYENDDGIFLQKYKDARNILSHINIIDFDLLNEVIDIFIKKSCEKTEEFGNDKIFKSSEIKFFDKIEKIKSLLDIIYIDIIEKKFGNLFLNERFNKSIDKYSELQNYINKIENKEKYQEIYNDIKGKTNQFNQIKNNIIEIIRKQFKNSDKYNEVFSDEKLGVLKENFESDKVFKYSEIKFLLNNIYIDVIGKSFENLFLNEKFKKFIDKYSGLQNCINKKNNEIRSINKIENKEKYQEIYKDIKDKTNQFNQVKNNILEIIRKQFKNSDKYDGIFSDEKLDILKETFSE